MAARRKCPESCTSGKSSRVVIRSDHAGRAGSGMHGGRKAVELTDHLESTVSIRVSFKGRRAMVPFAIVLSAALLCSASALDLSNQFASSMVLQREPLSACLHGAAAAGERITLTLVGGPSSWQSMTDATGHWRVCMDPQPAGGPHVLNIVAGEDGSTRARSTLPSATPMATSLAVKPRRREGRHPNAAPHS